MSAERLSMPCYEGKGHTWGPREYGSWGSKFCSTCQEWSDALRHHHGMFCMWESGKYVPECDFVIERNARIALREARQEDRWAAISASWRRSDERKEAREERWRQVRARYEAERAARQGRKHQRQRLQEGHRTLTAMRRLLARGVHRSPRLEFTRETSSPTS